MAAGPGEHAERQTSSWLTSGLHESVASRSATARSTWCWHPRSWSTWCVPSRRSQSWWVACRAVIMTSLEALAPSSAPMACRAGTGCGATFPTEFDVPILHPTRTPDDTAARTEAVQRLCWSDATRAAAVRRLAARLQRNERPPGTFKRAA
jgi:hypothetical protein